jgi:hypothetical protein
VTIPGRLVLLGHPVRHSLSPRFQNAALRAAGIPLAYEALDVHPDALGNVLIQLRSENAAGNVTVPHKAAVAAACDRQTGTAIRTGAVNTFWCDGTRLVGDNTDVAGFRAPPSALGQEPWTPLGLLCRRAPPRCALSREWPGARVDACPRPGAAVRSNGSRPAGVAYPAEAIHGHGRRQRHAGRTRQ